MTDKSTESAVERYEGLRHIEDELPKRSMARVLIRQTKDIADAALAELKAENEALRCCGNCGHYEPHHDPYGDCEQQCDALGGDHEYPDGYKHDGKPLVWVDSWDHCHWKVSRWTERGRE